MGFFTITFRLLVPMPLLGMSQSLSGWDGVFHYDETFPREADLSESRNPFQGGMGFFTGQERFLATNRRA